MAAESTNRYKIKFEEAKVEISVIYIHGFGSSGFGVKAELFRQYFKSRGVQFLAPSLSYVPQLAMQTLTEIAKCCKNPVFIGSSLGGFYSLYLANKFNTKAVLINPALYAESTLRRHIKGYATNFYDLSRFEWNDNHLSMLKKYKVDSPKEENLFVLLQKGDDILDYRDALALLPNAKVVVEEGGSHSFDGIERYFAQIEAFLLA